MCQSIANVLLSPSLSAGLLVCVFCIVAVQGAFQVWSLAMLGVLFGVCLVFTLLIWRQPESKTKLSFKVRQKHKNVDMEQGDSSLINRQDIIRIIGSI